MKEKFRKVMRAVAIALCVIATILSAIWSVDYRYNRKDNKDVTWETQAESEAVLES